MTTVTSAQANKLYQVALFYRCQPQPLDGKYPH